MARAKAAWSHRSSRYDCADGCGRMWWTMLSPAPECVRCPAGTCSRRLNVSAICERHQVAKHTNRRTKLSLFFINLQRYTKKILIVNFRDFDANLFALSTNCSINAFHCAKTLPVAQSKLLPECTILYAYRIADHTHMYGGRPYVGTSALTTTKAPSSSSL